MISIKTLTLIPLSMALISLPVTAKSYSRADKPLYISGSNDQISWKKSNGDSMPSDAVIAADSDKGPVYICQAANGGAVYPGQVVNNKCEVIMNNMKTALDDYQVLTSKVKLSWESYQSLYRYNSRNSMGVTAQNSLQPPGMTIKAKADPVIGGFEMRSRYYPQATLVCRAMQGTQIHIGKLFNNKCQISSNGSVANADMFQVLVVNNKL